MKALIIYAVGYVAAAVCGSAMLAVMDAKKDYDDHKAMTILVNIAVFSLAWPIAAPLGIGLVIGGFIASRGKKQPEAKS